MTKTSYLVNGKKFNTYAEALANAPTSSSITVVYEPIEPTHIRRTPAEYARIRQKM